MIDSFAINFETGELMALLNKENKLYNVIRYDDVNGDASIYKINNTYFTKNRNTEDFIKICEKIKEIEQKEQ